MKPNVIVQIAGIAAIVSSLLLWTFDGVRVEVFYATIAGILAVAAPQAFRLLLRSGGGG